MRSHRDQVTFAAPADDPFIRLRSVLDLLPVGVLLVAGEEPLSAVRLAFNGCFARLFGLPEGASPTELPLYYRADHRTGIPMSDWPGRRVIVTGEPVHNAEMHARGVDGVWRALLVSAAPVWRNGRIRGAVVVSRDATELHQAKEEARAREEQARNHARDLEAVLATVPAAVLITRDRASREMEVNRFGAELLGLPLDECASKSATGETGVSWFRALRTAAGNPADELPVQRAAREGISVKGAEFDLACEGGEVRHFLGNVSALTSSSGEPQGAVGAFVDITERRRAEEALREGDRRKDRFLAVLSHELRNPLAPIQSSLALLNKVREGARAERALAVMERQVKQMTRLIEDLLDVSRIASGKVQLRCAALDVRGLVQRAVDDHQTGMSNADLRVSLELPANRVIVSADPVRLTQVIGNLLQNAVKFTPPGGRIVVGVQDEPDVGRARVFVSDSGAGFDAAMREKLFQPFVQADATLDRPRGGLGLGLALVKGLVELHGGSVQAHSQGPGTGAEFSFTLPLVDTPVAACGPGSAPLIGPRRRVLVVEDNEDAAMSLCDWLEYDGHEVHRAPNGPVGIEMANRLQPDVVLCDIGLPGMNGYQVAKALRALGVPSKLVALTGYASSEDERLALESGFDLHVAKPADPGRIAAILAEPTPARS